MFLLLKSDWNQFWRLIAYVNLLSYPAHAHSMSRRARLERRPRRSETSPRVRPSCPWRCSASENPGADPKHTSQFAPCHHPCYTEPHALSHCKCTTSNAMVRGEE